MASNNKIRHHISSRQLSTAHHRRYNTNVYQNYRLIHEEFQDGKRREKSEKFKWKWERFEG